jgi:ubiquinone/menaquinone biosynthesis C-methylase UbiE
MKDFAFAFPDAELIRDMFDAGVPQYDRLDDLHDAWLFSRIHYLIAKYVIAQWDSQPKYILDVGCGTGFQSFLYASAGARVSGVDISPASLSAASQKMNEFQDFAKTRTLYPFFDFVKKYNHRVSRLVRKTWPAQHAPIFQEGDACHLAFAPETFDHINCCGSVLSSVDSHLTALSEMSRVLKKGGTFSIHVHRNYNVGLLCALFARSLGVSWSFGRVLTQHFTSREQYLNQHTKFPGTGDFARVHSIRFAKKKFAAELTLFSLQPLKAFEILSITNLIPADILCREKPSLPLRLLFSFLSTLEELSPLPLPGREMLFIGEKT